MISFLKTTTLFLLVFLTNRRQAHIRHFKLQLFPIYWRALEWRNNRKLALGRWQFRMRARWRGGKETGQVFSTIARAIIVPCAKAVFFVVIVWGFSRLPTPNVGQPYWFKNLLSVLHAGTLQPSSFDASTYVSLLTTLASIAGTFLGLYFTAISLVLSTSYADAPDDVRKLLMREKTGNLYTEATAMLLATSLLLLGMHSCGIPVSVWASYFLLFVLGAITTLGFVFLGETAFRFFDSTALVGLLDTDLKAAILGATPKGFAWRDSAFQDFL